MKDRFTKMEYIENNAARLPAKLVIDRSGSMGFGERMESVNGALPKLKEDLKNDPVASLSVELGVVAFNHTVEYYDFKSVDEFDPPVLQASGGTKIAQAINTGLDLVDSRKQEYRDNGIAYYRPIVFLLTDGNSENETAKEIAAVRERLIAEEKGKHAAFFCFGFADADLELLKQFTPPNRPPRHIGDARNIAGLFKWLSNSLTVIPKSNPGDSVELEETDGFLSY